MEIVVTNPNSELGTALKLVLRSAAKRGEGKVVLNNSLQAPNTLLHDGHGWKRFTPKRIVSRTEEILADPEYKDADLIVHASYSFLRAADQGAPVGSKLEPIVDAAREAEQLILADGRPARVVRLGYLYGPGSRMLKAYRTAFRIGRPYWAGPRRRFHHFLHTEDAARALLQAAKRGGRGRILYATDDRPASFGSFMDHFARLIGNPLPLHLPALSRSVSHLVVAEEHMQMVELGVQGPASPVVPGFIPRYGDYREGLAQVVQAWKS
jgi:hypothetical protein